MDGTYAPQSPDLSGFLASPNKQQQQQYQPSSLSASYAPRSPVLPSFSSAPQYQQQQQLPQHDLSSHSSHHQIPTFGGSNNDFVDYDTSGAAHYMPPIPALPPAHSFDPIPTQGIPPFYGAPLPSYTHQPPPTHPHSSHPSHIKPEFSSDQYTPTMAGRNKQPPPSTPWKNPNPTGIEIRTKFPVARIKRIMQADEEVGKVAQVTPVAVSKALELFMIALVSGAAEKAKEKGGKRVTAQHLKAVVLERNEEFDFLAEIVGKVAEGQEGAGGETRGKKRGSAAGAGAGSESESDEGVQKKKKGKGRKKKEGKD
ncbi:DNA polymerase epsilon subunit C [Lachnellula subtilissima]|uniref:NCT transcriptional regulatory complex subunit A n=1 Tax=Lachnellula subtilissima TaxID=602034 RepID=A0A8H8RRN6_9HELO|nr:DNA polymerase epsilon subunit C [Lachnellula subtilissima]